MLRATMPLVRGKSYSAMIASEYSRGIMSTVSRAIVAALVVATATAALAQSGPRGARHDFAAASLVAPPTDSWPTNGGNLYNQRYSPLNQINAANVAELKGVWRTRLRGSG